MFSFLSEFTRDVDSPSTFIVMDAEGLEQPRHYHVIPRQVLYSVVGGIVGLALVLLLLIMASPVKELIPGYGTAVMKQNARLNTLRVAALQDSLRAQEQYMTQLRQLMLGQIDSTQFAGSKAPDPLLSVDTYEQPVRGEPSPNWTDHQQPAIPVERLTGSDRTPLRLASVGGTRLPSILLPVLPPVDGFVTRNFDARTGHYAIDIAVDAGTVVRSIGEGYVILADWTDEGGYAIAVQHADGYVSVYKHNQRLLKRVGDRVHARDAIAASGNSGEISTGPHLHFELWHNGLAQDPGEYILGT